MNAYTDLMGWRDDLDNVPVPYEPATAPLSPATIPAGPQPDYLTSHREIPAAQNVQVQAILAQVPPQHRAQAVQYVQFVQDFGSAMLRAGVPLEIVYAAADWADAGGKAAEKRNHAYDLRNFEFSAEDQPFVTNFANAMSKAGASQSAVTWMFDWYVNWQAKQGNPAQARRAAQSSRAIEAQDRRDRDHAESVMREEWGNQYDTNIRLINRYLDSLPAPERSAIENATLPGGGLSLNNPDYLAALAKEARRPHNAPASAMVEKEELELLMADRNSAYWRGPRAELLQARYRDLVAGTGWPGQGQPTSYTGGSQSVAQEIEKIENIMRTDRAKYNRDPAMQQRLLELYRLRG